MRGGGMKKVEKSESKGEKYFFFVCVRRSNAEEKKIGNKIK